MRVFRRGLSLISDRDRAILQSRAVGLSIPEVAAAYGVAPHTVSNVITKVFDMLGVDVGVRGDPVYRMGRMMRAAYILGRVEGEG
jgi:DNA-binding NarL/FixJ family response regulator